MQSQVLVDRFLRSENSKMYNLTAFEKLILFFLSSYMGAKSECYPSITTLATNCSISVDSIKRHLKSLERKGLVEVLRTKGSNNRYRLALPSDQLGAESTRCTEHLVHTAPTTRCSQHSVLGAQSTTNNINKYTSEITSLSDNKKLSAIINLEDHKAKKLKRTKTEFLEEKENEIIKPNHEDLAVKLGLDCQAEFETFKDYHMSHGNKFLDWGRAFNNWLRNAAKFHSKASNKKNYSSDVMRGVF